MMELIRNWVMGVTCAAILIAVADSVMPSGTVKKIGKLTGGLVLLLAVMAPLVQLDYEALSLALTQYRGELGGYSQENANDISAQLMKTIIEEQTCAYILDKASDLGAACSVKVQCSAKENDLPYPVGVTVSGYLTDQQREKLAREIEADLAIPAAKQIFEDGEKN